MQNHIHINDLDTISLLCIASCIFCNFNVLYGIALHLIAQLSFKAFYTFVNDNEGSFCLLVFACF